VILTFLHPDPFESAVRWRCSACCLRVPWAFANEPLVGVRVGVKPREPVLPVRRNTDPELTPYQTKRLTNVSERTRISCAQSSKSTTEHQAGVLGKCLESSRLLLWYAGDRAAMLQPLHRRCEIMR
jgi:hypothetical protein